jgi:hypothetical protein
LGKKSNLKKKRTCERFPASSTPRAGTLGRRSRRTACTSAWTRAVYYLLHTNNAFEKETKRGSVTCIGKERREDDAVLKKPPPSPHKIIIRE